MVDNNFLDYLFFLRIDLNLYKQIYQIIKLLTMFIEGNCAIYIDKNLKVYEKSTVIFVLCSKLTGLNFVVWVELVLL